MSHKPYGFYLQERRAVKTAFFCCSGIIPAIACFNGDDRLDQLELSTDALFVTSAPDIRHLPADTGIEVAFAGRSNAGKSSALNTLTNQKNLARTSKTRGVRS